MSLCSASTRRRSRSRGMVFYRVLELAAGHEPVRYRNITAGNKPRKTSPVPPAKHGDEPASRAPMAKARRSRRYSVRRRSRSQGGSEARRAAQR